MSRDRLYPALEPHDSGYLEVESPHSIYWEESGNPDGVGVCFLHGGPGSGTTAGHRRFFDPDFYKIVLHDQRGAGRSRPSAETRNNDTQRLVEDIEALRIARGIDDWVVFGGSWGSTLALAYAEAHPERVRALVLRGIFLGRQSEVDWFLKGMGLFFPEEYAKFIGHLPEEERGDVLGNYLRRLMNPDEDIHGKAAEIWSRFEASCATLRPNADSIRSIGLRGAALPLARLEAHYFAHRLFLEDNELLSKIDRIRHIPCTVVQGRYDVICPPVSAFDLKAVWPDLQLKIVDDAGHSATEPGIVAGLVEAMDSLRATL